MDNFWGTGRFWNIGKTSGRKSHLKVVTSDGGLKETSVKPRIRPKPMCLIPKEPA